MILKRLEDICRSDIDALVVNRVGESKTIEFKSQLPGPGSEERKEFVRDIASFANASGGDIIYGIEETTTGTDKGRAERVIPITGTSVDESKLRLEQMIQNGLSPTLKVKMAALDDFSGPGTGFVLIVRIPQSLSAPHMVTLPGSYRFYSRTSSGKFPMQDVSEIRSAFLASEVQGERIRNFVRGRLQLIVSGETPVPMADEPRIALHFVPVSDFLNRRRIDLRTLPARPELHRLGNSGLGSIRYNIDGLLGFKRGTTDDTEYVQLNFDGTLEFVSLGVFSKNSSLGTGIPSQSFEVEVVRWVESTISVMKGIQAELPMVIFASLLSAKYTSLFVNVRNLSDGYKLDREMLTFPEIVLESWDTDVPAMLKPLFDALWNAYGFSGSDYFDSAGNWTLRA